MGLKKYATERIDRTHLRAGDGGQRVPEGCDDYGPSVGNDTPKPGVFYAPKSCGNKFKYSCPFPTPREAAAAGLGWGQSSCQRLKTMAVQHHLGRGGYSGEKGRTP